MLRPTITQIHGVAFLVPGTLMAVDSAKTGPLLLSALIFLAAANVLGVVAIAGALRRKGYLGSEQPPRTKET